MLLPNPIFLLAIAGNLLLIAYSILYRCAIQKRVHGSAVAFSEENPTGREKMVLARRAGDTYAGVVVGLMFILFSAMIFLPNGILVWDPGYNDFWGDPDFLFSAAIMLGMLVLAPFYISMQYAGEFFLLSEEGIERVKGRKRTSVPWSEATSVSIIYLDSGPIIRLASPASRIDLPRQLKGIEKVYEVAARRLPMEVRDSEGYRYIVNGSLPPAQVRMAGNADTKKARNWRIIGLVIAFGGIWVPLLLIPYIGFPIAGVLVMVILFGGLALGIVGSTRGASFYVTRELHGVRPEEAMLAAEVWLRGQGAEVVNQERELQAVHGTSSSKVWNPDARKNIELTFLAINDGTVVGAVLRPGSTWYADDVVKNRDRIMVSWSGWLEGMWESMSKSSKGGTLSPAPGGAAIRPSVNPYDR